MTASAAKSRIASAAAWFSFALFFAPGAAHADALRKADRAASGSHHASPHGSDTRAGGATRGYSAGSSRYRGTSFNTSGCADAGTCGDPLSLMFLRFTFGLPWSVPRMFDDPGLVEYAPYPFFDGAGYLRYPNDPAMPGVRPVRNVAVALDAESGYLVEGVVPAQLNMRLLLPKNFELDSRIGLLADVKEHPSTLAASGTQHITYRFAGGPRFDFRTGIGSRLFTVSNMRWGVDVLYAMDFYMASAWVLRTEFHLGSLERSFVGQVRGTLGYVLGPCEIYAGYDHTGIRSDVVARLSGVVAGLRLWL